MISPMGVVFLIGKYALEIIVFLMAGFQLYLGLLWESWQWLVLGPAIFIGIPFIVALIMVLIFFTTLEGRTEET